MRDEIDSDSRGGSALSDIDMDVEGLSTKVGSEKVGGASIV